MVVKLHTHPQRKQEFPHLTHRNHWVKSPQSKLYNCVAWALDDETKWWWPDSMGNYYWPPGATRHETIAAFVEMFGLFGFVPSVSRAPTKNIDRLALYARGGIPTHVARQLPNGKWTSKLGNVEDLEHTLEALEGPLYGQVVQTVSQSKPTGGTN